MAEGRTSPLWLRAGREVLGDWRTWTKSGVIDNSTEVNSIVDLMTPIAVLQQDALQHNLTLMAEFCGSSGVDIAPHAKTTMSPELVAGQLQNGAWAITAATMAQVQILRRFGVNRVILASPLVDPIAISWLARELSSDADFECFCFADSKQGVAVLSEHLKSFGVRRQLPVLVEIGIKGGRSGVRSLSEFESLVAIVNDSAGLEMAGVAGFEGILGASRAVRRISEVDKYLGEIRAAAEWLLAAGASLPGGEEIVVSAGGSAFFDRVADILGPLAKTRRVRVVLRSGCYVVHDHGIYSEATPLVNGTAFRPALQVWGTVLSRPEPRIAIVDVGKRDISYDNRLPIVLSVVERKSKAKRNDISMKLMRLYDQHSVILTETEGALRIGDLIVLGVSHPCTTFDKWRRLPVIDEELNVTGFVHSFL